MNRFPHPWVLGLTVLTACGSSGEDSQDRQAPPTEEEAAVQPAFSPEKVLPSEPPIEDSQTVVPAPTVTPDQGPYPVGGEIERPQRLGGHLPIDGLITMMRSGEYNWGVCIFQLTITEKGDVTDIEFLKPEDLAAEVQAVIVEAATEWKFRPATRDGEPVPVYYNLLIHHCPLHRKNRTVE